MNTSILIANRTGGQGKTLVAQFIALGFLAVGLKSQIVAIDSVGPDSTSKLSKYISGVIDLRISPNMEDIRRDPKATVSHWDRLGEILLGGSAIIDVGANVVDSLLDWALLRHAGEVLRRRNAPPITLVVPIRPQAQAVEDGLTLIERTLSEDGLPIARRIVVLNEFGGDFSKYGTMNDFQRLSSLKKSSGVAVTRLSACSSELWPHAERQYMSMLDAVSLTTDELESQFALNPFAAAAAHAELLEWMNYFMASLRALNVIPPVNTSQG